MNAADDESDTPEAGHDERGPDEVGPDGEVALAEGQLAYDCAAWATESRRMLASLLDSAGLAHAWQGPTLTVHEADEAAVDDLVDEVLAAAGPALDPAAPKVAYEVGEWPVGLQTELTDALTAADVAYEWDERGDLVVLEEDEEAVSLVMDELPDPDEAGMGSDDGVAVHELFDRVFMSSDRLARHGGDASGTVGIVEAAGVLEQLSPPFGFEPREWRSLVDEVRGLRELISPSPTDDDHGDDGAASDEEISERARSVRDLIRRYV